MSDNYYYSAKTGGFYRESDKEIYEMSPDGWPQDAVAVTAKEYRLLLEGQAIGKVIIAGNSGKPKLIDHIINWQACAEQQRQNLLTAANATIADWRTELQLDVIGEEDKAALIKWMSYIKAVKALDLTAINDEGEYKAVIWPILP